MASLTDVVLAGEGNAHAWRVGSWTTPDEVRVCELWHYSTLMLRWNRDNPCDESILDYSLGWGSVSDQQGMNKAFKALGIPRYYSRKGGAEIVETDPANAELLRLSYLEMRERFSWVR